VCVQWVERGLARRGPKNITVTVETSFWFISLRSNIPFCYPANWSQGPRRFSVERLGRGRKRSAGTEVRASSEGYERRSNFLIFTVSGPVWTELQPTKPPNRVRRRCVRLLVQIGPVLPLGLGGVITLPERRRWADTRCAKPNGATGSVWTSPAPG
jgi:hypothetical protein